MAEIIIVHQELVPANRFAHIRHDLLDLGPSVHAMAVIVPHVAVELQLPPAIAPRLDAQYLVRVAEVVLHGWVSVSILVAASQAPAVFCSALVARDALADAHGRWSRAACPVEGVDVAVLVRIVFEVHVGGQLGLGVGVEVIGGAVAGGLADGVEVHGPPDRIPILEVFGPVAVVDGAGIGGIPGLVKTGAIGISGVGEAGSGVFEDCVGNAVDNSHGTGGGC